MTTTLWHIELSHYSEKARFALAYKGVEPRLRTPLVGLHQVAALALSRGTHRRMPVLVMDGRAIPDSTAIIAALEERFPEPPLYPDQPADRVRALELEEYFDECLAPAVRAFAWHQVLREPRTMGDAVAPTRPVLRRVLNTATPLAGVLIRRDYGATEANEATARAAIVAAADRVERELAGGDYLVGDRFSVADLTGAALFTPLLGPPQRPYLPDVEPPGLVGLRDELLDRDAGRWVFEMYARHRGATVPAL